MGREVICKCDQCNKEGHYNPNWDMPNKWFDVKIAQDILLIKKLSGMYCSIKCIIAKLEEADE